MKLVVDSNIIISAFSVHGLCTEVFELCLAEHEIYLCMEILDEVKRGLVKKIKIPETVADKIIGFLREKVNVGEPTKLKYNPCRDFKDLMVLGIAESSCAEIIISGDQDLLVLKKHKNTKILSPRQFWELLRA